MGDCSIIPMGLFYFLAGSDHRAVVLAAKLFPIGNEAWVYFLQVHIEIRGCENFLIRLFPVISSVFNPYCSATISIIFSILGAASFAR